MLPKRPNNSFWKFVKGSVKTIFVIEVACLSVSYGIYYRMNTNREFRQYINEKFPFILDYYYKVGEVIGNSNLREIDSTIWRSKEKKD